MKEDRESCPCLLSLDLSEVDQSVVSEAELMVSSGMDMVWKDHLVFGNTGDTYTAYVPRKELHLSVWAVSGQIVSSDGLCIPEGEDCPKVYMYDSDIRAYGEEVCERVVMYKNHCVMTVMTEHGDRFPHEMKVVGNVSGYTSAGQPSPGYFEYTLNDGSYSDGWQVVLPRQMDSSLVLQVDDGKGTVKSFSVGQYIVSSGYDWTSPDLDDVTVSMDYALTEMTIKLEDWESVFTFKVEI